MMNINARTIRLAVRFTAAGTLLAACGGIVDTGKPGVPVTGAWRYVARQSLPGDAELTGTLSVTNQSGASIGGALDVIETDARGLQRRLAGTVTGRTIDSTTVDMDIALISGSRRHVGVVRGDSLTGSWIETPPSGGAPSASGTFRAARQR